MSLVTQARDGTALSAAAAGLCRDGDRVAAVHHPLHPQAFARREKTLLGSSLPPDL